MILNSFVFFFLDLIVICFFILDYLVEKELCLVFFMNVIDKFLRLMFIEIDIKYFVFGVKYSFDIKIGRCYEIFL